MRRGFRYSTRTCRSGSAPGNGHRGPGCGQGCGTRSARRCGDGMTGITVDIRMETFRSLFSSCFTLKSEWGIRRRAGRKGMRVLLVGPRYDGGSIPPYLDVFAEGLREHGATVDRLGSFDIPLDTTTFEFWSMERIVATARDVADGA